MKPLRQLFLEHIAQTSDNPLMVEVARAEGVYFYSPDGRRYIDLIAGVSVSNLGHGNRAIVEAVQRQAADYMHVMVYGELIESPQVRYAALLAELLPDPLESVYFVNSGAEAIEGALKLARRATGRTEILSMWGAYHGSTMGAMSVMGGDEWSAPFQPLIPDTHRIMFNNFDDLEHITERTACVLVEPVQGEAGVRLPEKGYLEALRKRCMEMGALLIFDEIQTGFGRTGAMFACEKYGVVPDIICLGKALGGGMPLGAFVASRKLMSTLSYDPALGHITTFGGHPVCCAAGFEATKLLQNLISNQQLAVSNRGHMPELGIEGKGQLFEELLKSHSAVKEIRRSGLLLAVEFFSAEKMYETMKRLIDNGILSDWFLFCDTAFRISPPLIITEEQIRKTCEIIRECLD